ncbi:MAG: NAD(P)/FAD-dependent oxidoreductase [Acidobacteriota bacterium]
MTGVRGPARLMVVGGGPAGLAVAIEGRLRGLDVRVVDRRRPPIDKACGEGLMPDGLERLRGMGVELGDGDLRAFRGIRYVDGETRIEGRFPGGVAGAGIRRPRLHRAMVERAEALGVVLDWGTRVLGLTAEGVTTERGDLGADIVVGADGLLSRVRRWAGVEAKPARRKRFGVRRHVALAPWTDLVEVHWSDHAEAYVTPVAPDEVGVAILWRDRKARFDDLLGTFPELEERLSGAEVVSRDRGAGPLRQGVGSVVRGRVALVGDASGYVDAITGEGLSMAFHQAAALAEAIAGGKLDDYRRLHRRIGRVPLALTELLLWLEGRPRLRRRAFRALAADPDLFERFLAVHCRAAAPMSLGPTAPRLLWGLVRS